MVDIINSRSRSWCCVQSNHMTMLLSVLQASPTQVSWTEGRGGKDIQERPYTLNYFLGAVGLLMSGQPRGVGPHLPTKRIRELTPHPGLLCVRKDTWAQILQQSLKQLLNSYSDPYSVYLSMSTVSSLSHSHCNSCLIGLLIEFQTEVGKDLK